MYECMFCNKLCYSDHIYLLKLLRISSLFTTPSFLSSNMGRYPLRDGVHTDTGIFKNSKLMCIHTVFIFCDINLILTQNNKINFFFCSY